MPAETAARKKYKADHRKASRASGRDIGAPPPPERPKVRAKCSKDLLAFLLEYLPERFPLAFSADHLAVIADLQKIILEGGMAAVAMPRGSGKTTIMEGGCLWALLYGHRQFLMLIAADADAAESVMESIKAELDVNDAIGKDFPDAVHAIRALEGIARRAEGQTSGGERTHLLWTKKNVRLPAQAAGGGSVIRTAGITGRIRGAKAPLASGAQVRPDLVLIDDPQTDESARSPSQVATRLRTVCNTVLGLAGPGKRIAALCACTIIEHGDLADQLLDRQAHPEWQGRTAKLMRSMPSDLKLWDEYADIYRDDLRNKAGFSRAIEFYQSHRDAMDKGAEPAWPERKEPGELSAIQHAMNLRIVRGQAAFDAEFQNDPADPMATSDVVQLTPELVLKKCNGYDRAEVTHEATMLTAGIDIQEAALYWSAHDWCPGFGGNLLSAGAYPDPGRYYFTLRDINEGKTLAKAHPDASWKASLYAGLDFLITYLLSEEWMREDGTTARIEYIVIDAGYHESTDAVFQYCKRSQWSALLMPYFGRTVKPGSETMGERKRKTGERIGQDWIIRKTPNRQGKHVMADANAWKSFVADRILTPAGASGSMGLFGRAADQRMYADHLCSEYRTRVTANGRVADIWAKKPNEENHWFDTSAMAAIAASIRGMKLDDQAPVRRSAPDKPEAAEDIIIPTPPPVVVPPPKPAPVKPPPQQGDDFGFTYGGL